MVTTVRACSLFDPNGAGPVPNVPLVPRIPRFLAPTFPRRPVPSHNAGRRTGDRGMRGTFRPADRGPPARPLSVSAPRAGSTIPVVPRIPLLLLWRQGLSWGPYPPRNGDWGEV